MKINRFHWDNYKLSKQGRNTIKLFENFEFDRIIKQFGNSNLDDPESLSNFTYDFIEGWKHPEIPESMDGEQASEFLIKIIEEGIDLEDYDSSVFNVYKGGDYKIFINGIIPISCALYQFYPAFYLPYLFNKYFSTLIQICDKYEIDIGETPLKKDRKERAYYYGRFSAVMLNFGEENDFSPAELCAFLYDFGPKSLENKEEGSKELPKPTQVWMVGGDTGGGDFTVLDAADPDKPLFWQGNVETRKGDIIIMYVLSPRSCIHSVWRATTDGIADPFFYHYSNIYIGHPQKVSPIHLNELKSDIYFSKHPLVRKNLQGVNGYPFTSEDYENFFRLLKAKEFDVSFLPQLYRPGIKANKSLKNEREVEIHLVEPFLIKLGYTDDMWERQLVVKMGVGERNYPDYAFFIDGKKNYESAQMILEAKFEIKTNVQREKYFHQALSYALRLQAKILLLCDKDAIWIHEKVNDAFDRGKYVKKYWQQLEEPDEFRKILNKLDPNKVNKN